MSDTSLYVDITELSNDGDILTSKSSIINENINNINDLLSHEWNSWLGEDSDEYVSNLKQFLTILSSYSSELNKIGNHMKKVSNDYQSSINTCLKELTDNE